VRNPPENEEFGVRTARGEPLVTNVTER
jgi:hypothetical protein